MFHCESHLVLSGGVFYHFHPQHELTLVRASSGSFLVGDMEHPFEGLQLVLIGANLPHRWRLDGGAEFFVVAFSRHSLGLEFLERAELADCRDLLLRADRGIVFGRSCADAAAGSMGALVESPPPRRLRLFLELVELLVADGRAAPLVSRRYSSSTVEQDHRLVARLVSTFGARPQEEVRLEEAASCAGMSVAAFTRFFRRMTGSSFVSHLNALRIRRACGLLASGNAAVADVAGDVGFRNLAHFNRQFRRFAGCSPREFRSRSRSN